MSEGTTGKEHEMRKTGDGIYEVYTTSAGLVIELHKGAERGRWTYFIRDNSTGSYEPCLLLPHFMPTRKSALMAAEREVARIIEEREIISDPVKRCFDCTDRFHGEGNRCSYCARAWDADGDEEDQ